MQSCLCCNLAVSATRMYVMDKYHLHSDPCDRRIIRCNNCIQVASCVCSLIAYVAFLC